MYFTVDTNSLLFVNAESQLAQQYTLEPPG